MIHVHSQSISDFECEILLIANCELLYKTQSKESQENEYTITHDHTPGGSKYTCKYPGEYTYHRRVGTLWKLPGLHGNAHVAYLTCQPKHVFIHVDS